MAARYRECSPGGGWLPRMGVFLAREPRSAVGVMQGDLPLAFHAAGRSAAVPVAVPVVPVAVPVVAVAVAAGGGECGRAETGHQHQRGEDDRDRLAGFTELAPL